MEVREQICPGPFPSGIPLCVLGVPVDKACYSFFSSVRHGHTHKCMQTRDNHIIAENTDSNEGAS